MKTTIEKAALLSILRENRGKHQRAFEEAWGGYQKAAIQELENALQAARDGRHYFERSNLTRPVNMVREYDRAIRMVELNVHPTIELDDTQFNNLVLDRWNWSRSFAAANKSYLMAAGSPSLDYIESIEHDVE